MQDDSSPQPPVEPVVEPVAPEPTYSKNEYEKLQKEAAEAKKQLKELAEAAKIEKEAKLRENKSWQELSAIKEKEAQEAKARVEKLTSAFVNRERMNALREEAIKAGIKKESLADLRLLDFPELSIQTDSEGEVIISGADKAIQRMKTIRPYWFGNSTPAVNTTTPGVTNSGDGTISWETLTAANKKAEATGNYTEYKEMLLKYKAQLK